jgi:hydroxymethylpyrimidine/phosphomethylpyrimidine kinase
VDPPVALTIAGSDSGGGAGIQADLLTFAAHAVHGTSALTAITAQSTTEVRATLSVDPAFVELQVRTVLDDMPVRATKTGMLATAANVRVVAQLAAEGVIPNLVVDPVLVSSSGKPLLDEGGLDAYRDLLVPRARVLTPNLFEAALLASMDLADIDSTGAMEAAARRIAEMGAELVVVKGGHLRGAISPDVVLAGGPGGEVTLLPAARVATRNDHGTGCTFSAAIAAWLARGAGAPEAATRAKEYVTRAIGGAATWTLGAGHGPVDHFGWGTGRP